MLIELKSDRVITIGVVSDTHVPDRVSRLHPNLESALRSHQPDYIFHGGDISRAAVIDELEAIAPVYAVTGNRDFLLKREFPMNQDFLINGVKVLLTHGHKDFFNYWIDKLEYVLHQYHFKRYFSRLQKISPRAKVFIFGHSHHAENLKVDGRLFFNPGAASLGEPPENRISYGMLKFHPGGEVEGQVIPLTGYRVVLGKWKSL